MSIKVLASFAHQVFEVQPALQHHLKAIQAIYLFGSAVDSGLKPLSDIDLLVTVATRKCVQNFCITSVLA